MSKIKEIRKAYNVVNNYLNGTMSQNVRATRHDAILMFENEIKGQFDNYRITCDETNNTPEVIDSNQLALRFEWTENNEVGFNYINLFFGRDVEVDWGDEPSMIGETFRKQLLEEGVEPDDVASFVSNYNKKTNTIVTVVTMEDGTKKTIVAETTWYASRKNKKW